ncbi:hypothetical protein BJ165DRAFT_1528480 [Panaeolus papilionaceus]|nr:hypothetical protein BJ165DRAFT_1528480 [Panaeolus papilionaceus]
MSTTTKEYQTLRFKGPVSVAPVTPKDVKGEGLAVHILMGPTGSGKSAFVESLSGADQDLDISKNSLESVTKDVTCYRVVNVAYSGVWQTTYLLLDNLGFLDTYLSESRITSMITDKLDSLSQSAERVIVTIVYFQPITDIRLGASKRDAIKLLRAFAKTFKAKKVVVVTTMWNNIATAKHIENANRGFNCLRDEILASADEPAFQLTKFMLFKDLALSNLDGISDWSYDEDRSTDVDDDHRSVIRSNLLGRIANVRQQLQVLAADIKTAITPGQEDPCLLNVVLRDEKKALAVLQEFLDDLYALFPALPFPRLPPRSPDISLSTRFKKGE